MNFKLVSFVEVSARDSRKPFEFDDKVRQLVSVFGRLPEKIKANLSSLRAFVELVARRSKRPNVLVCDPSERVYFSSKNSKELIEGLESVDTPEKAVPILSKTLNMMNFLSWQWTHPEFDFELATSEQGYSKDEVKAIKELMINLGKAQSDEARKQHMSRVLLKWEDKIKSQLVDLNEKISALPFDEAVDVETQLELLELQSKIDELFFYVNYIFGEH